MQKKELWRERQRDFFREAKAIRALKSTCGDNFYVGKHYNIIDLFRQMKNPDKARA